MFSALTPRVNEPSRAPHTNYASPGPSPFARKRGMSPLHQVAGNALGGVRVKPQVVFLQALDRRQLREHRPRRYTRALDDLEIRRAPGIRRAVRERNQRELEREQPDRKRAQEFHA